MLSLFFIDEVAKYRQYDENGEAVEGEYTRIFREQYRQILSEESLSDLNIENDAYKNYLKNIDVEQTYAGYFSVDKKSNQLIDPSTKSFADEELGGKVNLADDIDAYDLILKDKESLLAFPDKNNDAATRNKKNVRFLFSHSILREGWDTPNVYAKTFRQRHFTPPRSRAAYGCQLFWCVGRST